MFSNAIPPVSGQKAAPLNHSDEEFTSICDLEQVFYGRISAYRIEVLDLG
jgi:hypothetical protein